LVYDIDMTMTLSAKMSATSGLNAIAHAVEALYAKDFNPIVLLMAEEGVRALVQSLPRLMEKLDERLARIDEQYGAWLCGSCLGVVGMALHHKICHALGGVFDLPHAEMHPVLLPHVAAFNAVAAPQALGGVGRAIGGEDAGQGLYELSGRLGIPRSLRELGMPADGIERAVALITEKPYWNPRIVDPVSLCGLLQRAFNGEPPIAE
jgi:maleylacetate reductase